jgi:ABC-type sugar transport system permease subunit
MALTASLIRSCLPHLEKISESLPKVREKLAQSFSSENEDLGIEGWTPKRLVTVSERVVRQIRLLFNRQDHLEIPHTAQWDVYGSGPREVHIETALGHLQNFLAAENWTAAAEWAECCLGYLVTVQFWNTADAPLANPDIRLNDLVSEFQFKADKATAQIQEINNQNKESARVLNQIATQADEISNSLERATSETQQISKRLNEASLNEGKVSQIFTNQEKVLSDAKDTLESTRALLGNTVNGLKEASDTLESAKTTAVWIEAQKEIVNTLAGTAAAGILGTKFEARAKQLESGVAFWRNTIWIASTLSAVWIAIAWKWLRHEESDFWATIAANFGLLLPPAFLLGFVGINYSRERHFQEEYAFRSAIAMTLSAFAERLGSDTAAQKELIKDTVQRLYQTPILLSDHPKTGTALQPKDVGQLLEKLSKFIAEAKKP